MKRTLMIVAAAGTCLAAGPAALAQQLINISGASLLENYVKAPASTNDYIDVDKNLVAGSLGSGTIQQLAGPSSGTGLWTVQYRVVGSVNGFIELTKFGAPSFITTDDTDPLGILGARPLALPPIIGAATTAYNNRVLYINGGAFTGAYTAGNPGGAPNRALTGGANRGITVGPAGGITIDVAPLDVASKWATRKTGGSATPFRTPLELGYGLNPRVSSGKNGESAPNAGNPELSGGIPVDLPTLNGRNHFDIANPGAADANTLFDTQLAFAPIAPVINLGTGITQIKVSELQHIFTTGRAKSGENFVVVTRDVGSGTRNAFMNCIGIDPSWGVGDNIGDISALARENNLGQYFYPSNKGANGGMEGTLRNARLGIGYIGTERGVTGSGSSNWLGTNALEIPNVQNDIYGGSAYVRPTTTNLVHNDAEHWVIGGQSVLVTLGDPRAEPVADGGDANGHPAMVNKAAAAYVNNISRSIEAFVATPGGSQNDFMPGEFAATQFLLLNALDKLHSLDNPLSLVPNPSFVQNLQNYTLTNNVHNHVAYTAFNTSSTGRNPTRTTGATYSDGVVGGNNYIAQNGATVTYGAVTATRNKVAFDFNGDNARTLTDATDMIAAWRQRNGGAAWIAPTGTAGTGDDAVIEILGDANGDGSFTSADVRYWADGLALVGGKLDRKAGFTAVDAAFGGNFFNTALATNKTYSHGDSRADVIGTSGKVAPGWAPVGADGVIDAKDIDYIYKNMRASGGSADWEVLTQAAIVDLSCDVTGDLKVTQADVNEVVTVILGTCKGDVNLNGRVNLADRNIVDASIATPPVTVGWASGDVNGDGVVNAADRLIVCPADFNCDSSATIDDLFLFLNAYFIGDSKADMDDVNGVAIDDLFLYINQYFTGC